MNVRFSFWILQNNFCSISKKLIDSRTLIETFFIIRSNITVTALAGKNFSLYQLNGSPACLIFTQIGFTIYHDLCQAICMYSQQIDELPVFKFSMQIHIIYFTIVLQTLCNFAPKHFKKKIKIFHLLGGGNFSTIKNGY